MKFQFPKDKKTESVNISVYKTDIDKIRKLAEINNCSQVDVYKTIISEAIEEYEEKFGKLEGKKETPSYSVKRDFVKAGDNRRKEVLGDEKFDGGGDLRTHETKPEDFWAVGYKECIDCHSSKTPHAGRGLCRSCYAKRKKSEKYPNWKESGKEREKTENEIVKQIREVSVQGNAGFCQYRNCPNKGKVFNKDYMRPYDDLLFCSKDCEGDYKLLKDEDFEEENYYSSPSSEEVS